MPRIVRKLQKIFASNAANNGQFGSAQIATPTTSNDLSVLQALSAYTNGWSDAVVSSDKLPTLEEIQALTYIETTQLAYLFQEGIPEYDATTTYYQNSVVKQASTYKLYGSVTNDNTGNALTNPTYWTLLLDMSDVASKTYVDSIVAGLSPKSAVRVATTANLTSAYVNGVSGVGATLTNTGTLAALTIDTVALVVGNRVLVKNQTAALQNGIYTVTVAGSGALAWVLTRATDYDTSSEITEGSYTISEEGSLNVGGFYIMTTATAITVGTTAINFTALNINTFNGILAGANGGTGVANTGRTITLAGNLATAGAFNITLTATNTTGVTLPTTGTISTLAGVENLTNKTMTSMALAGTHSGDSVFSGTQTFTVGILDGLHKFGTASATNNATLTDVAGMTINVIAGATYRVSVWADNVPGAGGWKLGFGGTATYTAFRMTAFADNAGSFAGSYRSLATGTLIGITSASTAAVYAYGAVTASAAGTITLQFAQNASNAAASVLSAATLTLERIS